MGEQEQHYTEAFEAHADELFRHAYLRLSERERAVELVQECYLRTWEYLTRGGEVRDFRSFLFRTLRHLIIDEYRRRKSISLESLLGEEDESIEVFLPPDETNTLESAALRFDASRVLSAVEKLPELYREIILLRYVDGLAPKEIAAIIDESENVVSVRVHRALRKLRTLLDPTL